MIAVLTADLIDSTRYSKNILSFIIEELQREFEALSREYEDQMRFALFRGDSFQGVLKDPLLALTVALRLKATVKKAQPDPQISKGMIPVGDVRIAIGIGQGEFPQGPISTANDQAYQFSGKLLDGMKEMGSKTSIQFADPDLNAEFFVHFSFLDNLIDRWTVASSEVVYYLLKGLKEQEIADILDRSQAAINLRKKAASWQEIKFLMLHYDQVTKKLCDE